jgi:hypothetical protein
LNYLFNPIIENLDSLRNLSGQNFRNFDFGYFKQTYCFILAAMIDNFPFLRLSLNFINILL